MTPLDGRGWPVETKAVVAAAAVAAFLALLTWGGSLWMYVRPADFRLSSLMLQPWPSVDFALFVLHALLNAAIILGALTALGSQNVARRILLAAALCLLALALYKFASFSVFQTGLRVRREGPDQVYWLVDDGTRLVVMNLVFGLLVLALSRQTRTYSPADAAGWITGLVIAAVAVDGVVHLANAGVTVWVSLQPSLFKTIGAGPWTAYGIVLLVARVLLYATVIAGAAAMLVWRRQGLGRRLLILTAAGLLALTAYSYVRSLLVAPPPSYPRYQGPELIKNTVIHAGNLITAHLIHVLVLYALIRRRVRGGAAASTTGGDALPRLHG